MRHILLKALSRSLLGAALILAVRPDLVRADDGTNWSQRAWLGAQVGFNIRAKFSLSGQFPISSSQPGPAGVSGVDHFYNDGYVRVDQTGDAQGFTSFWGYRNASQYDGENQTLVMHSATAYSASASSTRDDQPYVGLQLGYGSNPFRWGPARIGLEFGFGYLPIRITDEQPLAAAVQQSVYSFDTGGIVMPTAPYNGGPSGIGPTIHDVATALPGNILASTVVGSRKLDTALYTFRLGPAVHWDICRYFGVSASAGGAIALVSGDLKFNEQILLPDGTSAANSGSIGSTEVVYGGFVSATARFRLGAHAEIYASAQYMPLGNATTEGGGRRAELDLGGQVYVSGGFSWPF